MRILVIVLTLISTYGQAQRPYAERLLLKLEEIKNLSFFNNSIVVYTAHEGYGSTFPEWKPDAEYYQDDIVYDQEGKFYHALIDNQGKVPNSSPNEWQLRPLVSAHPYFFLRDSTKTEDLKKLLYHEHAYIKTYAFAALAHRGAPDLFSVIVDHLGDTTKIDQITSDYGYPMFPAELMITHLDNKLTNAQKEKLRSLIQTEHKHLASALKILESQ